MGDARLVEVLVAFDVAGKAALDEQLVADGGRPLRGAREVHRRGPDDGGRVRIVPGVHRRAARLPDLVGVGRELVAGTHLPRDARQGAVDRLIVHALIARDHTVHAVGVRLAGRHVERVRNRLVDGEEARGGEEPDPVLRDRPALGGVDVVIHPDLVQRLDAVIRQKRREVIALPGAVLEQREERPAEPVAALLRDQIHLQPARGRIGCAAARLIDHLLASGIVQVALDGAVALKAVDDHPVHQHRGLPGACAVDREVGLLHRLRPAHVGRRQRHADDQLPDRLERVGIGNRVEDVARKHRRARVALDVHDGRGAGHRHGFLHGPDFQLGVDGRDEAGRQLDVVALIGVEAGQRDRDGVHARTEVHDLVRAQRIGDDGARPLDERRTGRLHRRARKNCAGRVPDDARNRTLRVRKRGEPDREGERNPDRVSGDDASAHRTPPVTNHAAACYRPFGRSGA